MKVSKRRTSLGDMYLAGSKPFTSPAICEVKAEGSKRVMRVMPDLPARMLFHASDAPMPTGETMPRPVTTTLRLDKLTPQSPGSGLYVRLDVVDSLLDSGDLFRFLVGDLGLELLFESHHQLHSVERVRAQVVDERG